jgi:hypothetical protein
MYRYSHRDFLPIFPPQRPTDFPSSHFIARLPSHDCRAGDHECYWSSDQCPQLQKWNGRVVAHVPIFPPRLPTDIPSMSSYRYSSHPGARKCWLGISVGDMQLLHPMLLCAGCSMAVVYLLPIFPAGHCELLPCGNSVGRIATPTDIPSRPLRARFYRYSQSGSMSTWSGENR